MHQQSADLTDEMLLKWSLVEIQSWLKQGLLTLPEYRNLEKALKEEYAPKQMKRLVQSREAA